MESTVHHVICKILKLRVRFANLVAQIMKLSEQILKIHGDMLEICMRRLEIRTHGL